MLLAYLAANKVGSKLICPHRHLERLVVLCWDINVPQENAAGARTVRVASSHMQDKSAAQRACPQPLLFGRGDEHTYDRGQSSDSTAL